MLLFISLFIFRSTRNVESYVESHYFYALLKKKVYIFCLVGLSTLSTPSNDDCSETTNSDDIISFCIYLQTRRSIVSSDKFDDVYTADGRNGMYANGACSPTGRTARPEDDWRSYGRTEVVFLARRLSIGNEKRDRSCARLRHGHAKGEIIIFSTRCTCNPTDIRSPFPEAVSPG